MPVTVAAFIARNRDVTPVAFQSGYENSYLPLLKSSVGSAYPEAIFRNYVKAAPGQEDMPYDLISFMQFKDEAAAQEFQAKYKEAYPALNEAVSAFAQAD